MLRFVPPAGAPLETAQILRASKAVLLGNGHADQCLASTAARLRVRYAFAMGSGRAALWLILRALQRLRPDRSTVALPAYTCFTVAASIVRAGLKPYPVEIDSETLDFDFSDLESLPPDDLLCIVSSNLLGFVNDLERIENIAHARGAFVVDDAAQALGASRNGRLAGTSGDAGLFSFGRGKPVAAIEGGVVVTNSQEISATIQAEASQLPASSLSHNGWLLLQMLAYRVFLNPRLYWLPNALPFLKLGVTEFAPRFPVTGMPAPLTALFPHLLDNLPSLNQIRIANARLIAQGLAGNPRFKTLKASAESQPTYLRFPVLAADEETRERAVTELHKAGIGATPFYPSAICDIPGLDRPGTRHCPQAESLARRLLTLPTHPFVSEQDVSRMLEVLAEVAGTSSRS